jgi:hypothetical protein
MLYHLSYWPYNLLSLACNAISFPDYLSRLYDTDDSAGNLGFDNAKTYQQIGTNILKVESDPIGYDPGSHDL